MEYPLDQLCIKKELLITSILLCNNLPRSDDVIVFIRMNKDNIFIFTSLKPELFKNYILQEDDKAWPAAYQNLLIQTRVSEEDIKDMIADLTSDGRERIAFKKANPTSKAHFQLYQKMLIVILLLVNKDRWKAINIQRYATRMTRLFGRNPAYYEEKIGSICKWYKQEDLSKILKDARASRLKKTIQQISELKLTDKLEEKPQEGQHQEKLEEQKPENKAPQNLQPDKSEDRKEEKVIKGSDPCKIDGLKVQLRPTEERRQLLTVQLRKVEEKHLQLTTQIGTTEQKYFLLKEQKDKTEKEYISFKDKLKQAENSFLVLSKANEDLKKNTKNVQVVRNTANIFSTKANQLKKMRQAVALCSQSSRSVKAKSFASKILEDVKIKKDRKILNLKLITEALDIEKDILKKP